MINAPARRSYFWLVVAIVFFIFLYLIRSILLPFVLGVGIAYFLDPAADKLEKYGLSRGVSTLLITGGFFFLLVMLLLLVIPVLAGQFTTLVTILPTYLTQFEQKYTPIITQWFGDLPMMDMDNVRSAAANFSGYVVRMAGGFIAGIFQSGMAFVNLMSLILITPVVAFYLLEDWDHIVARIDGWLPRHHADTIRSQLAVINETLAGFVRGQINVCLLLAAYYTLLLSLLGLHFSIIIGVMTGFLVIVPYAGWTMGALIGVGVAFFQFDNLGQVGTIAGVFLAGQVIESYFLTPKLVGEKVGLHPVWIIFGMLSGAALFGFVGVLLAVPVTAVAGVLLRFALQRYLHSNYYQGEPLVVHHP